MRHFLYVVIYLVSFQGAAQSSQYWYELGEVYLKIKIAEDGLYKLDLENSQMREVKGENEFPHLVYQGKEVPIHYVQGTEPYLEFYAEKNKGARDSLVYQSGVERANPYVPLFSESATYFLYWNDSPSSLWKEEVTNSANFLPYVTQHKSIVFESQYSFNNSIGLLPLLQQSEYENGEGWTGPFISMDSSYTLSIPLEELVNTSQSIDVEFQLNGRSRNEHLLRWYIDGKLQDDTLRISPFGTLIKTFSLNNKEDEQIDLTFEGIKQAEFDWFSLTYINWSYPSSKTLEKNEVFSSVIPGNLQANGRVVQLNSVADYSEIIKNPNSEFYIESSKRYRVLSSHKSPEEFSIFKPRLFATNANYIILTDPSLKVGCEKIRTYRESMEGGLFNVSIIYTNDVYDHFNYGERSPIAIRNYAKWLLDQGVKDPYLYLVGRPITFPDVLKKWEDRDLVPSFGYPASDALFTAGLNPDLGVNIPAFATGRLNVTTNEEIENYLNKVIEHESQRGDRGWKKNFLHLSGGRTVSELDQLSGMLQSLLPIADSSLWQPKVQSFRKRTLEEVEPLDISKEVNEGLGMITFAGHGSANVLDLNIGYADTPESGLANKGKYPIMYFNGCGVGNVFYRYDPLSTDWLLAKDRGAIAVFANSFWSYLYSSQVFLQNYYSAFLSDSETVDLRIGQIHQRINQKMNRLAFNPFIKANMNQIVLQGDPALHYFDISKPDYKVKEGSIRLSSSDASVPLGNAASIEVSFEVENVGRIDLSHEEKTLKISIDQIYTEDISLSRVGERLSTVLSTSNFENNFQAGSQGRLVIPVRVNVQRDLDELDFSNNTTELVIDDWNEAKKNTSWPISSETDQLAPTVWVKFQNKFIPDGDLIAPLSEIEVFINDENPLDASESEIRIELSPCSFCVNGFVPREKITLSKIDDYTLKAAFTGPSQQGTYNLQVSGSDRSGNPSANNVLKSFRVSGEAGDDSYSLSPNPAVDYVKVTYFLNEVQNPITTKIRLFNVRGQEVVNESVDFTVGTNEALISTSHLPSGAYNLKIELDFGEQLVVTTRRIIVW